MGVYAFFLLILPRTLSTPFLITSMTRLIGPRPVVNPIETIVRLRGSLGR